jgi:hypothetical protein
MDDRKTYYIIAGKTFSQQPVTLGQARWLLTRFKGYPLFALKPEDLVGLIGEQVSALCAIVLIEDGQTLLDKVKAGAAGLTALEAWLDAHAQPEEVAQVVRDFFDLGQLRRAMGLLPGSPPAPDHGEKSRADSPSPVSMNSSSS